ncbi:exported hypothetical protein [Gammaproteobacteria bacterium]
MKNKNLKNLFVLLFSICIYHASYAVDNNSKDNFYPEIKNYRLEYEIGKIELDIYGADSTGHRDYKVYFSSSSPSNKISLNLLDQGKSPIVGDAASNSILPDSAKGRTKTSWRLTRTTSQEVQQPKFFEVVDESNQKIIEQAMPEINVDLSKDNKTLIIKNDSSESVIISSVIRKGAGSSGTSEVPEGTVIDAANFFSTPLNLPSISEAEKNSKGGAYRFDIAYEVSGTVKHASFVIEYSCNLGKEQKGLQQTASSKIEIEIDKLKDGHLVYDSQSGKYNLTIKNTSDGYIDINSISLTSSEDVLVKPDSGIAPGATYAIPLSLPLPLKSGKYSKHVFVSYYSYSYSVNQDTEVKTTTAKTIKIPVTVSCDGLESSIDKLIVTAGSPVSTFSYVLPQQDSVSQPLTYKEVWARAPQEDRVVDGSSSVYYEIINTGDSPVSLSIREPLLPVHRTSAVENNCGDSLGVKSSCTIKLLIHPEVDSKELDKDLSITPTNLSATSPDLTSSGLSNELFRIVPLGEKVEYQFDITARSRIGLFGTSIEDVVGDGIKALVKKASFIREGCDWGSTASENVYSYSHNAYIGEESTQHIVGTKSVYKPSYLNKGTVCSTFYSYTPTSTGVVRQDVLVTYIDSTGQKKIGTLQMLVYASTGKYESNYNKAYLKDLLQKNLSQGQIDAFALANKELEGKSQQEIENLISADREKYLLPKEIWEKDTAASIVSTENQRVNKEKEALLGSLLTEKNKFSFNTLKTLRTGGDVKEGKIDEIIRNGEQKYQDRLNAELPLDKTPRKYTLNSLDLEKYVDKKAVDAAVDEIVAKTEDLNSRILVVKKKVQDHDYTGVSELLTGLDTDINQWDGSNADNADNVADASSKNGQIKAKIDTAKKDLSLDGKLVFEDQLSEVTTLITDFNKLVTSKIEDLGVVQDYVTMQKTVKAALDGTDEAAKDAAVATALSKDATLAKGGTTLLALQTRLQEVSDNAAAAMKELEILDKEAKYTYSNILDYRQGISESSRAAFIVDMLSVEKMIEELKLYGEYLNSVSSARDRIQKDVIPLAQNIKFADAQAEKNKIVAETDSGYKAKKSAFEEKYLKAPYSEKPFVQTVSLDTTKVIAQELTATDTLKVTVDGLNNEIDVLEGKIKAHDYKDVSSSLVTLQTKIAELEKTGLDNYKAALKLKGVDGNPDTVILGTQSTRVDTLIADFNKLVTSKIEDLGVVQDYVTMQKTVKAALDGTDEAAKDAAVATALSKDATLAKGGTTLLALQTRLQEVSDNAAAAMKELEILDKEAKYTYSNILDYRQGISESSRAAFIVDMLSVEKMIEELKLYGEYLNSVSSARDRIQKDVIPLAQNIKFADAQAEKNKIVAETDSGYKAKKSAFEEKYLKAPYSEKPFVQTVSLDTTKVIAQELTATDTLKVTVDGLNNEIDVLEGKIKAHDYKDVSSSLVTLQTKIAELEKTGLDNYKAALKLKGVDGNPDTVILGTQSTRVDTLIADFNKLVTSKIEDLGVVQDYVTMQKTVKAALDGTDEAAKDAAVATALSKDATLAKGGTTLLALQTRLQEVSDNAAAAMKELEILDKEAKYTYSNILDYRQGISESSRAAFIVDMLSVEKMIEELKLYGEYLNSVSSARDRIQKDVIPLAQNIKFADAQAEKNKIVAETDSGYKAKKSAFEEKYLKAPYSEKPFVQTVSLDTTKVIAQELTATDTLKVTVDGLNNEIDVLEGKIKAHDYKDVSSSLKALYYVDENSNVSGRIFDLENSGLVSCKSALKLTGANTGGSDYVVLGTQKSRVEALTTDFNKLDIISVIAKPAITGEFTDIYDKAEEALSSNKPIGDFCKKRIPILQDRLNAALGDAVGVMKQRGILKDNAEAAYNKDSDYEILGAGRDAFIADMRSVEKMIAEVNLYKKKITLALEAKISVQTDEKNGGSIGKGLASDIKGNKYVQEDGKNTFSKAQGQCEKMILNTDDGYKNDVAAFEGTYSKGFYGNIPLVLKLIPSLDTASVTPRFKAIKEINVKVNGLDNEIAALEVRIRNHDLDDMKNSESGSIESVYNSLRTLKTKIDNLEKDGEIVGYKGALGLETAVIFGHQNTSVNALTDNFAKLMKIDGAARMNIVTKLDEIKKNVNADEGIQLLKDLENNMKQDLDKAEDYMLTLGILTSIDNKETGTVTFSDNVGINKVKFGSDVSSFRQLRGEVIGYRENLEAIKKVKDRVETAISVFVEDSDFTKLSSALKDIATEEAVAYKLKQELLTKKYGTLDTSFVDIVFTDLVKVKVDAIGLVMEEIENTKNNIEAVAVRIKGYDFNADSSGKKSVSILLDGFYSELGDSGLRGKVNTCVNTLKEISSKSVPYDIKIIKPLNTRVKELRDNFEGLQGINSISVKAARTELQNIRNSISSDPAAAGKDIEDLSERLKKAKSKAERAREILENDLLLASTTFNGEKFKIDSDAFDEFTKNEVDVLESKISEYIKNRDNFIKNMDAYKFISANASYNEMVKCLNHDIKNLKIGSSDIDASPLKNKMDAAVNILGKLRALRKSTNKEKALENEKGLIYDEFKKLGYCVDGSLWGVTCKGSDKTSKVEFVDELLTKEKL